MQAGPYGDPDPVLVRDNFICRYCGKDLLASLDDWHSAQVDHVMPINHGGSDGSDNKVCACAYCNSLKHGKRFSSIEDAKGYILERRKDCQKSYEAHKALVRGNRGFSSAQ